MPLHPYEATRPLGRTGIDMPASWKLQVPEGPDPDGAGPVEQYKAINPFFHRFDHFNDRSSGSVRVQLQHGVPLPAWMAPRVLDKVPVCPVTKVCQLT